MEESKLFEILGYVKVSPNRTKTLKSLGHEIKMPSEIARESNTSTSQVSAALADLKRQGLVICLNEEVRKGRLYKSTELGLKIIEFLK